MELTHLIEALSRPEAYPFPAGDVEVHQTHISAVFLAGDFAYKVKKPVDLGFLDFTTLERRLHFCREEVRLNRRLAPDVYRGVVPIVKGDDNTLRVEGVEGPVVEYAVKMQRLPEAATFRSWLDREELTREVLAELARRIADFHERAARGPEVSRYGRWPVVARNALENLRQSRDHVGTTLSAAVFERLSHRVDEHLTRLKKSIERRAEARVTRDTHGDLHLDHVYWFPDRPPPDDLVVIDCIEFNERFRYADPVADVAFLVMDLLFQGHPEFAATFADAYFEASCDAEGRDLLPFYVAYRAAVRAKVAGMMTAESEVPDAERNAATERARAYWLMALGALEEPACRPCLLLIGGLPGTGKSTLARLLGQIGGFHVVSTDRVRKELAGLDPETPAPADFGGGIYTSEWNDRTYEACLARAEDRIYRGERVIVDGSFREEGRRQAFIQAACRLRVPVLFLRCTAAPEAVRARMRARTSGPSDADWTVYTRAAEAWENPSAGTARFRRVVDTDAPPKEAVESALDYLAELGLWR